MGKEITTKMTSHTAKEYWGGDDRGVCLQVTASGPLRVRETAEKQIQEEGFIQLTMVSRFCPKTHNMKMTMWDRLNQNEKSAMKAGNGWHDNILVVGKYIGIKNTRGGCDWKEVIDYDDKTPHTSN